MSRYSCPTFRPLHQHRTGFDSACTSLASHVANVLAFLRYVRRSHTVIVYSVCDPWTFVSFTVLFSAPPPVPRQPIIAPSAGLPFSLTGSLTSFYRLLLLPVLLGCGSLHTYKVREWPLALRPVSPMSFTATTPTGGAPLGTDGSADGHKARTLILCFDGTANQYDGDVCLLPQCFCFSG